MNQLAETEDNTIFICYLAQEIGGSAMHSKNEILPLEITQYDIESAQEFLYNINWDYFKNYVTYSSPIENQVFNSDNDISTFIKPVFVHCQFLAPNFNGIVGENSSFHADEFYNCDIQNANFRYADFSNCKFQDTCITINYPLFTLFPFTYINYTFFPSI